MLRFTPVFSTGSVQIITEEVRTTEAMEEAASTVPLTAFVGSIIPSSSMLAIFILATLYPYSLSLARISGIITSACKPAFSTIVLNGALRAVAKIVTPIFSSSLITSTLFNYSDSLNIVTPPPGK